MSMKWFEFNQNNSGGSFVVTSELCHRVFIEAKDDIAALSKGMDMGIYLNGCATGEDCSCCGDRWYQPSEVEFPVNYGNGLVFNDIQSYAQHLATKWGWTKPDARIYPHDGKMIEVFK